MAKHDKTFRAIFARPTSSTLIWSDIEALLKSLGATVAERNGSRVAFFLEGSQLKVHRPHPRKEASKGSVEAVREFLTRLGYQPE